MAGETKDVYEVIATGYGQVHTDVKPEQSGPKVTIRNARKAARLEDVRNRTHETVAEIVSEEMVFVNIPVMIRKLTCPPSWFYATRESLANAVKPQIAGSPSEDLKVAMNEAYAAATAGLPKVETNAAANLTSLV